MLKEWFYRLFYRGRKDIFSARLGIKGRLKTQLIKGPNHPSLMTKIKRAIKKGLCNNE